MLDHDAIKVPIFGAHHRRFIISPEEYYVGYVLIGGAQLYRARLPVDASRSM